VYSQEKKTKLRRDEILLGKGGASLSGAGKERGVVVDCRGEAKKTTSGIAEATTDRKGGRYSQ